MLCCDRILGACWLFSLATWKRLAVAPFYANAPAETKGRGFWLWRATGQPLAPGLLGVSPIKESRFDDKSVLILVPRCLMAQGFFPLPATLACYRTCHHLGLFLGAVENHSINRSRSEDFPIDRMICAMVYAEISTFPQRERKMAAKTSSRKIVPKAPQESQRKKLVEEYARLDAQVALFKPTLSRYEKLRTFILDWYPNLAPEEEESVAGENHDILISSRDQIRTVTEAGKQKLWKLWGTRGFIAKCVMHLKSLPDPKDDLSLYSLKALTGPRHLTVVSRVDGAVAVKRSAA